MLWFYNTIQDSSNLSHADDEEDDDDEEEEESGSSTSTISAPCQAQQIQHLKENETTECSKGNIK